MIILLSQARPWTLIIWTLWTQNSTEICLLWKLTKGMFRLESAMKSWLTFKFSQYIPPQDYVGIDFTVVVEEFGQTRIELLKPEGDSIPVTSENRLEYFIYLMTFSMPMIQLTRIEYIHLVADYKLNRQIKAQCSAFRSLDVVLKHDTCWSGCSESTSAFCWCSMYIFM